MLLRQLPETGKIHYELNLTLFSALQCDSLNFVVTVVEKVSKSYLMTGSRSLVSVEAEKASFRPHFRTFRVCRQIVQKQAGHCAGRSGTAVRLRTTGDDVFKSSLCPEPPVASRRDKGEGYLSACLLGAVNPKVPPEPFNKRGSYAVTISRGRNVITSDTSILQKPPPPFTS